MDADRFKRQFIPLHARLYRMAYAMTDDRREAEDILQEAYCKLWRRRAELSHISNAEAFCVTLVKNLCFDYLRSRREGEASVENLALAGDHTSPETEVIERDEVSRMKYLIERLPANQRQVLRLYSVEEYSAEEIEQITGLGAVNIRVLLYRARKTLKEQYLKLSTYERQGF
ncbi:MAG: sigma-70 family RNA polymerase sigma factor [Tannerellaceae bacterium]|jgi:RNA polymerase sigma-70 factor (ECF subfamily)|nr:sigma-70 family RNA polymerase sigma factor [Tannerellaceae bacterium]